MKRFETLAPLHSIKGEPFGLFHRHYDPRVLSSPTLRPSPFTDVRDSQPSPDDCRTVEDDDARGHVHGVGQERLADRDGRHRDGQARGVGRERHAALLVQVQLQPRYRVGIENNDWSSNHQRGCPSYNTPTVKINFIILAC